MKKNFLFFSVVIILLNSCTPAIHVFSDYDRDAKIDDYKTYHWLELSSIEQKGTNPLYSNELNDKRIKSAVNKEMKAKGFQVVAGKAELELHYHIIVEDKKSMVTEPFGYNYGTYWERQKVSVFQYQEGTLIIDLMDTKNNSLVWRGWATGAITDQSLKKPEEAIQYAVNRIFKSFPYSSL